MNDKGEIQEFANEQEAKAAGFNKAIPAEYVDQLLSTPEDQREVEFLWLKYWDIQKKHRTPRERQGMRHAFISGCAGMLQLVSKENGE